MPDEVREHLTRDQRPFLHPESLQIFRFTASPLQFTSLIFYRVQIRGQGWPEQKLAFVLSDPFLCWFWGLCFEVCVRIWGLCLYVWKIQTWPIIRFLTESVTYWFCNLLVFEIHDAMHLNKMSRTSSRYKGPQHQKYSSIFNCTHGVLFISPNPSWVFAAKLIFLFRLTIEASPVWSSSRVWQLNMLEFVFRWARIIFPETLPNNM